VGVLILAVGISGIQQLGGAFFVEPLFNGITLLIAIALAGFAQRRRSVTTRKPSITGLEPTRHSDMRSGEPSAFAEASADKSGPPAGTNSEREDGDGEVSPVT
jgi:hypothetical protein